MSNFSCRTAFAVAQPRWSEIEQPVDYLRQVVVNRAKDAQRRAFRAPPSPPEAITPIAEIDETFAAILELSEFLKALPPEVLGQFTDETHALAYALATDCFTGPAPRSELDEAITSACETEDWGRLSDIMTMDDLCRWSRFDGNADVSNINGGELCG